MFLRIFDRIIELAAVMAFAASSLMILINVVNRYLVLGFMREMAKDYETLDPLYRFFRETLGSVSVMADEVPGYLLVWIAFLGAYLALRNEGHIAFTMIIDSLSRKSQILLKGFSSICMTVFLVVLLYQSIRMIRVSGATEIETAEIAQGWFMAIIPIAAILFLLAMLISAISYFRIRTKEKKQWPGW